jgi:hypothetical protein
MKRSKRKAPIWTPRLKRRFTDWIEKWRGLLLLNGHHLNVEFSETACPDTSRDAGIDELCAAQIGVNRPYMSGHKITIYPRMLSEPDLGEQERKIVHELIHIVTDAPKDLTRRCLADKFVTWREVTDADERATDWIANIVWALYDSN